MNIWVKTFMNDPFTFDPRNDVFCCFPEECFNIWRWVSQQWKWKECDDLVSTDQVCPFTSNPEDRTDRTNAPGFTTSAWESDLNMNDSEDQTFVNCFRILWVIVYEILRRKRSYLASEIFQYSKLTYGTNKIFVRYTRCLNYNCLDLWSYTVILDL